MICPKCSTRLGCYESKPTEFGTTRRYRCASCKSRFCSEERLVGETSQTKNVTAPKTKPKPKPVAPKPARPKTLKPLQASIKKSAEARSVLEDRRMAQESDPLYESDDFSPLDFEVSDRWTRDSYE